MSDRDDKKRNEDDLAEIRSLIGDTDTGGFSLEDILAEYGSGKVPGGVRSLFPPKRSGSPGGTLTCPGRRSPAPPGVRGR